MIAVTGASGRLGRLTVRLLLDRTDAARVVALTRTPQAVADLGVTARTADFDRPDGLVRALDGVERLLLISTSTFDTTGRRTRQHADAVRAATRAGVGHVVYTSILRADDPTHPAGIAADHRATEDLLTASGLTWTVLRNSMYTQFALAGIDRMLASGLMLDNVGDGAVSYVTREDCAAVAATVLADGGYEGRRLAVTGPRALTLTEVTDLITDYTGVVVRYLPISDEATVSDLVAHGMAEATAWCFASTGKALRDGYADVVTDVVERVVGHPATSVGDFLAANLPGLLPAGFLPTAAHGQTCLAPRIRSPRRPSRARRNP